MRAFFGIMVGLLACDGTVMGPRAPTGAVVRFQPASELDLLLMIDNTFGTEEEQAGLGLGLPALLTALREELPGGPPDLHAGVITSDLGAGPTALGDCLPGGHRGVLRPVTDRQSEGRFLTAPAGRSQFEEDAFAARLAKLGQVGREGCLFEHPLASIAKALDREATPENDGFVRSSAHLAILFLTDEDDCSAPPDSDLFAADRPDEIASTRCSLAGHVCHGAHPPAAEFEAPLADCDAAPDGPLIPIPSLVDAVRAAKANPDWLTVVGIFGAPSRPGARYRITRWQAGGLGRPLELDQICASSSGEGYPGLRLARFLRSFGGAELDGDICKDDPRDELGRMGRVIAARMTSACLAAPATSCQVTAGTLALPRCEDHGLAPCWRLGEDPGCAGGARLYVDEARRLAPETTIEAQCVGGER